MAQVADKILAQSLMEVRDETELKNLRTHKREMQDQLEVEMHLVLRLQQLVKSNLGSPLPAFAE